MVKVIQLLTAQIATGAGTASKVPLKNKTLQAKGTTTASTGAAVILVEVSNLDTPTTNDWILLATINLTLGTTSTTDGFVTDAPWKWIRGNVDTISGTGASVDLYVGY